MQDHALAREGFVVFRMDPRSASGKGAISAWSAYKHLGVQELEDIKTAINWLKQKPYVDGSRIGMAGHSYGGYITSYAMTHCDLFAAGIAGAPVTDWRDYDSIYTERYMGLPQDNPEGYNVSSVVRAAGNLHGKLLILHGAIDDNVSLAKHYEARRGTRGCQQGLRADDLSVVAPRDLRRALHPAPARVHSQDARQTQHRETGLDEQPRRRLRQQSVNQTTAEAAATRGGLELERGRLSCDQPGSTGRDAGAALRPARVRRCRSHARPNLRRHGDGRRR